MSDWSEADASAAQAAKMRGEEVEELARRLRIPTPPPPPTGDQLAFPPDPSALPGDLLIVQMSYWNALATYTATKAAVLRTAAVKAVVEYEQEFDVRYTASGFTTVTDKRHTTGASPTVRRLRRRAVQLESDADILETLRSGYEKNYGVLSRELSRRGQHSE